LQLFVADRYYINRYIHRCQIIFIIFLKNFQEYFRI